MLSELKQGKTSCKIHGSDLTVGMARVGYEKLSVSVNGISRILETVHAKSVAAGGVEEFWVLNDENNPLIIKMKTSQGGFNLKEITE